MRRGKLFLPAIVCASASLIGGCITRIGQRFKTAQ
jgi:hypothetical protein